MQDDQLNKFINGMGALAEACRIFYNSCIDQKFTQRQSFELTTVLLMQMIAGMNYNGDINGDHKDIL